MLSLRVGHPDSQDVAAHGLGGDYTLPVFDSPWPRVKEPTPFPDRPPRCGASSLVDLAVQDTVSADRVTHSDLANAVRVLAMDAVEQAKSGHPGLPMGA